MIGNQPYTADQLYGFGIYNPATMGPQVTAPGRAPAVEPSISTVDIGTLALYGLVAWGLYKWLLAPKRGNRYA